MCALPVPVALRAHLQHPRVGAVESARVVGQRAAGAARDEGAPAGAQAVLGDARGRLHEFDLRRPGSAVAQAQHQAHADCVRRLAFAPVPGAASKPPVPVWHPAGALWPLESSQPGQAAPVADAGRGAQAL